MQNIKIEIKKLNVFYKETQAINDLCLEIPANSVMSVLGPAKSGITTLLRSLNRLCELNPEAVLTGEILIDGENIYGQGVSATELRRRAGMVYEVPTPLPMSIYENVAFGLRLSKKNKRGFISDSVEQALKLSALWDEVKDRLGASAMSLSGGQQQRLCIARVLALKPEVILLDRPCSGLDPISTAKIEDFMNQLKKDYTLIIAPHNVQQAARISDRVAFMLQGVLVEEGTGEEIFSNPRDKRTSDYITGRFG